jgi:hypothetical protein
MQSTQVSRSGGHGTLLRQISTPQQLYANAAQCPALPDGEPHNTHDGMMCHKSNSQRPRLRSLRHSTPSAGATNAYASSCLSWLVTRTDTCPVFFEFRLARPDTWRCGECRHSQPAARGLVLLPRQLPPSGSVRGAADRQAGVHCAVVTAPAWGLRRSHLRLRLHVRLRADVAADGQVVAELHQAGLQLQRTAVTGLLAFKTTLPDAQHARGSAYA